MKSIWQTPTLVSVYVPVWLLAQWLWHLLMVLYEFNQSVCVSLVVSPVVMALADGAVWIQSVCVCVSLVVSPVVMALACGAVWNPYVKRPFLYLSIYQFVSVYVPVWLLAQWLWHLLTVLYESISVYVPVWLLAQWLWHLLTVLYESISVYVPVWLFAQCLKHTLQLLSVPVLLVKWLLYLCMVSLAFHILLMVFN